MRISSTFSRFAGIEGLEVLKTVGRVVKVENRSTAELVSYPPNSPNADYISHNTRYLVHLQDSDGRPFYAAFNTEVNTLSGHEACVLWYRFEGKKNWQSFAFADWEYSRGFVEQISKGFETRQLIWVIVALILLSPLLFGIALLLIMFTGGLGVILFLIPPYLYYQKNQKFQQSVRKAANAIMYDREG